ncbi:MAG: LmbE family N-acetylglucosaminyl deacetylase [Sphingobacteriales bacterium]|jgi:LmbE family N-acetylglucosaminyl deacetylase
MIGLGDKKRTILVLAPHTDDGELGCGGTISKLTAAGHEVLYVAFSACELSVPSHLPKDILITEVKKATPEIGIRPGNLILFNYPVRTFNYSRQEILQNLIDLRTEKKPDLVFIPALTDLHQDHATIAAEALRAFKGISILSYELPWNNLTFTTTCFVKLTEDNVKAKIRAMSKYESQKHRPYATEEYLKSLAHTRGVQIGTKYAEVFEVVRWIIE